VISRRKFAWLFPFLFAQQLPQAPRALGVNLASLSGCLADVPLQLYG
jgi:hypothetical protein